MTWFTCRLKRYAGSLYLLILAPVRWTILSAAIAKWLAEMKGKQIVLIAARRSEALANYWYYNGAIRGVVYVDLAKDIRQELAYVINGRFLRKDIKKDKITNREMQIIRMTAQGMHPKSIAKIENCSVKTVYTHRRNAEAKLYSKIYKLAL